MTRPTTAPVDDDAMPGTTAPGPATPGSRSWTGLLAAALIGTARGGGDAGSLVDAAAAHALRRRAGVALVPAVSTPEPAPVDGTPRVGPAAAARADALLALDYGGRDATPVRDLPARLALLTEWLAAAAAAGRRLPPEQVPALLDAGRRHRQLRPWIVPVAGPLAGWLAAQRADWSYASATPPEESMVDDPEAWELGSLSHRAAYLERLRRRDPARARELLEEAWEAEPPDNRAGLLPALAAGLSPADEPLLERALDDRRRPVRDAALGLLRRLPASGYARRMAARAADCVRLDEAGRFAVRPPATCDRSMRRDGIAPRPPAGTGERAWWLEEILARTPLATWPEPAAFRAGRMPQEWASTVRRGLARAAASQRDHAWAAALVEAFTADVAEQGRPDDRLLLESLYQALPPDALASLATTALRRGLAGDGSADGSGATGSRVGPPRPRQAGGARPRQAGGARPRQPAGPGHAAQPAGVEQLLSLCPRPWPPAVVEAVLTTLADQLSRQSHAWRAAALCELAGLGLPAAEAPRVVALVGLLRDDRPLDPALAAAERLAATLHYRHQMLEELASDR